MSQVALEKFWIIFSHEWSEYWQMGLRCTVDVEYIQECSLRLWENGLFLRDGSRVMHESFTEMRQVLGLTLSSEPISVTWCTTCCIMILLSCRDFAASSRRLGPSAQYIRVNWGWVVLGGSHSNACKGHGIQASSKIIIPLIICFYMKCYPRELCWNIVGCLEACWDIIMGYTSW